MEGSLDIAICGSLNYIYMTTLHGGLKWETIFQIVNNSAFIVLASAVGLFPIWAMYFYCKNFDKWEDEEWEEKYGAALEGVKKDKRSALAYPMIFMIRRFALVIIVTIARHRLFVQIPTMVLFSTIQVGYLASFRPSEE